MFVYKYQWPKIFEMFRLMELLICGLGLIIFALMVHIMLYMSKLDSVYLLSACECALQFSLLSFKPKLYDLISTF